MVIRYSENADSGCQLLIGDVGSLQLSSLLSTRTEVYASRIVAMSLSTTTTAAYILTKYSRSYPTTTSRPTPSESDWQHFTNPTIRLVLDVRKSRLGELESYRMRVIWSIDSDPSMMELDHRDVTFVGICVLFWPKSLNHSFFRKI